MTIKNNPADDVISIIVPCFNEESVLPAFYSAVSDAASSIEGAVCVPADFIEVDTLRKAKELPCVFNNCIKSKAMPIPDSQ